MSDYVSALSMPTALRDGASAIHCMPLQESRRPTANERESNQSRRYDLENQPTTRNERKNMETRFYQTQDLNLQAIAQSLALEYQAQGYETQQFGDINQMHVQLKKESTLRTITGFNKALGISLQRVNGGTLVRVGAQDWMDQIVVGAVGLAVHPLLVTAAVGALQQHNVVHDVLNSIDYQIRQQQPQAQVGDYPPNL